MADGGGGGGGGGGGYRVSTNLCLLKGSMKGNLQKHKPNSTA